MVVLGFLPARSLMLSFGSWLPIVAAALLFLGAAIELAARIREARLGDHTTDKSIAVQQLTVHNSFGPENEDPVSKSRSMRGPSTSTGDSWSTLKEAKPNDVIEAHAGFDDRSSSATIVTEPHTEEGDTCSDD
jgi:hypothetical protein